LPLKQLVTVYYQDSKLQEVLHLFPLERATESPRLAAPTTCGAWAGGRGRSGEGIAALGGIFLRILYVAGDLQKHEARGVGVETKVGVGQEGAGEGELDMVTMRSLSHNWCCVVYSIGIGTLLPVGTLLHTCMSTSSSSSSSLLLPARTHLHAPSSLLLPAPTCMPPSSSSLSSSSFPFHFLSSSVSAGSL
jgi:hypothetical protein